MIFFTLSFKISVYIIVHALFVGVKQLNSVCHEGSLILNLVKWTRWRDGEVEG